MNYAIDIRDVRDLAAQCEWTEIDFQEGIGMISFRKDGIRLNIYLTKMTVVIIVPKSPQVTVKKVSIEHLNDILLFPKNQK